VDNTENKNALERKKNILRHIPRISLEILFAAAILWVLFILTSRYSCKAALISIGKETGTKITADALRIKLDGSVEIDSLTIRPDQKNLQDQIFLKAQKTNIRLSLPSLFLLKPRLKRISIDDFTLSAVYDCNNGRWNLPRIEQKLPEAKTSEIPTIYLNNGTFQYCKISGKDKNIIAQIPFQFRLVQQKEPINRILQKSEKVFQFEFAAKQWSNIGAIKLDGTIRQNKIEISGAVLPANPESAGGPPSTNLQVENIKAFLNYQSAEGGPNYSLTADVNGLKSGKTNFAEQFKTIRSFATNPQLGEKFQNFLDRSQTKGSLDAKINITGNLYKIMESKIIGKVFCKNINFCDKGFEYPVENLSGPIDITESSANLNNLQGKHKNAVFLINGWTKGSQGQVYYKINVSGDNVLLDKDVYSALTAAKKKIWDDFSPTGKIAIDYTFAKESALPKTGTMNVTAKNCRVFWKMFNRPFNNITGRLSIEENQVTFSQLTSKNGIEKIIIDGKIAVKEPNRAAFDVNLNAENIDSNSILQKIAWADLSLLAGINKPAIIDNMHPSGRITLTGHFKKDSTENQCSIDCKVNCLNDSLEYKKVPYHFEEINGNIYIQNNRIRFENLKAATDNLKLAPEKSLIKIDGEIKLANDKFDSAELRLKADDIALDERLGAILPEKIQPLYFKFNPTGLVDLNFDQLKISDSNRGKNSIEAAGTIYLKQCNIETETKLTQLQGLLDIQGLYKNDEGLCAGRIRAQDCSLAVKEKKITELNADIVYDKNNKSWHSDNLTGDCYNGKMNGYLELDEEDDNASYLLDLGFDGIDLHKFLSEPAQIYSDANHTAARSEKENSNNYTRGRMDAAISISGQIGRDDMTLGRCCLKIKNMEVGKVSLLGKLLSILQFTEPRDFTFEQMVVNSYLTGNRLLLDVDISGQKTAFQGEGTMDLKKMIIDLLLKARGRRFIGSKPGPLQTLTEGLGQGIVQINVKGSVYSPQLDVVALPVIKGTMGLFGTKRNEKKIN
jgi:hypothetical protein